MNRTAKIIMGVVAIIAIAILVGRFTPIPVLYSDFMSMYHALLGWSKGYSFYDFVEQQRLILETARAAEPDYTIELYPYFPYPPWYGGATFFLAWLSYEWAYRVWLIINLWILMLSALLLTVGQSARMRILAIVAFALYFPAVGLFVIGNYTLPVLLGGALFLYAIRHEDAFLTAFGLGLLTFKPHIGIVIALFGFSWLWFQRSAFAIRARWMAVLVGAILVGVGFLIEPEWLISFPKSMLAWQTASHTQTCEYCGSPANTIMRSLGFQAGMLPSIIVSLVLFGVAGLLIWVRRKQIFTSVDKVIAVAVILTAVALPYMVNYDFVILLIPLAVSFLHFQERIPRLIIGFLYLVPWAAIFLSRGTGNMILIVSGITLFALMLICEDSQPDNLLGDPLSTDLTSNMEI